MSVAILKAGSVMDIVAPLLNDAAKSVYTYALQIPYLQMASQELQEWYQLHSMAVTETTSGIIPVKAIPNYTGVIEIGYDTLGVAHLPPDLIELQSVWERITGINPFTQMTRVEYIPHYDEGTITYNFGFYAWQSQKIKVLNCVQDNDLKLDYIRALFPDIVNENSPINIVNARSFLEFRTAGLIAELVEHNEERASSLNNNASLSMDRATGISIKGKQNIVTRRRPFRSGWKRRGFGIN